MNELIVLAIIIAIIIVCIYVNRRRLPAREMRQIAYGNAGGVFSQKLYYPQWANSLRHSGHSIDEATVVRLCRHDPLCAAVAFTTAKQNAHRAGRNTPSFPEFLPYTLAEDTSTMYYRPTDAATGPDLFVKNVYSIATSQPNDATPNSSLSNKK
jgi:hypothetical protein